MSGHIRRRGERSWELKFDLGRDPVTGKREIRYHSVKGTKRDAQAELTRLLADAQQGSYVEPTKVSVADFVRARVDQWQAAGDITARTAQRYRQLVENQIVPHIGTKLLQKLTRLDVEGWHTALKIGGLAARTIGHAHRVLGKALRDAERDGLITKNVCRIQGAPKVADSEKVIVRHVPAFVGLIRGERLYVPAVLALFTGMRLGEILALRERSLDLDTGVITVREALEETKAGIAFKTPKSRAGRRDITLPDIAIEALRDHRKQLLETRMKLGIGKLAPDDLLFANLEGRPLRPSAVSSDFGDLAERIGMPEVTFHSLRHTHASQLISRGVDIVTISKRLGHAKPSVTLAVYAHMFTTDDRKAAAAINAALS
jgi:site-specific recombinase XerD